jgi:transposase
VRSLLDQAGISAPSGLFSEEGRAFLADLEVGDPTGFLLENWLALIDEIDVKLERFDRRIQQAAAPVEAVDYAVSAPGVAVYSGLMIHAELGEIDRFDRAAEAVSYAGLDPVVRESGETRREAGISKQGNGYLRWILYQCASAAVHNAKDPYLSEFYWRLRNDRGKSHQEAMVATSRKLLVSLFHMLRNEEVYNPAGAT